MKKLVFLILVFIAGYIVCLNYNILPDKNNNSENTNIINNTLNDLQAKIDTYKQKEQEEKIRKIELQQLQDPEIINTNLANVGKLLVYEGTIQYSDIIREKNWYSNKELTLELLYKFGISIDLQNITVDKFIDETVVLNIPVNKLKIEYLELDSDNKAIDSDKSFLATQFTPEDIEIVLENAKDKTYDNINSNKDIFVNSLDSLKQI